MNDAARDGVPLVVLVVRGEDQIHAARLERADEVVLHPCALALPRGVLRRDERRIVGSLAAAPTEPRPS